MIGGKRKFAIFEIFRAYLREFSIFFHEIYMVAKSYRVLAANIKSFSPFYVDILAFFKLSALAQAFDLGE